MRNRSDRGDAAYCPSCDGPREQWFTTCPTCDFPFEIGTGALLANQVAAPLADRIGELDEWIDLPIPADQPAKTALLRNFLAERGFEYEESRRFVSIRSCDAAAIEAAIGIWAFQHDLPEDHRHLDTLMSTLKEVGDVTIETIQAAMMATSTSRAERTLHDRDHDRNDGPDLDLR